MRIRWYDFLKSLFRLTYEVFWKKIRKHSTLENFLKYDEERVFFREKKFSSFQKPLSQKWGSARFDGGRRPSCCGN